MARIDIAAAIKLDRQERTKARYPVRSDWAPGLGHKCLRHLVHHRLHWDKAIPADEFAQGKVDAIFQDTNDRQLFVSDVKSMMGAVYNKINTVDDLLNSNYLRNYVDQVYTYELGNRKSLASKPMKSASAKIMSTSRKNLNRG